MFWKRKGSGTRGRSRRFAFEAFNLEPRRLPAYIPAVAAYQLNQVEQGGQYHQEMATAPDGTTTIVWTDYGLDGDGNGIYARRVDALGNPLGGQFRVNTTTAGNQSAPAIGSDAQGNVVVVWQDNPPGTYDQRLHFQRYDARGVKIGDNQLLPSATGFMNPFSLHVLPDGGFVVINNSSSVVGTAQFRRFNATGEVVASNEFALDHAGWDFGNRNVDLSSAVVGGGIVLTWTEWRTRVEPDVGTLEDGRVWLRRFDLDGRPIGGEVLATSRYDAEEFTEVQYFRPAVTGLSDGGYLASWYVYGPDGSSYVGRRFDASGTPRDRLITFAPTSDEGEAVTLSQLADGNILAVAVQERAFDDDISDFRVFSPDGDPVTARVPMPSVAAYYLSNVRVAATGGSRFLLTWNDQSSPPRDGEVYLVAYQNVPTVGFTASTLTVGERGGAATVTVTRDGPLSGPASVRYSTLSESATGGADYSPASSVVVTFAPGQATATFSIPIFRDAAVEDDETFLVTLADPTGVALGDLVALRVTIVDDFVYNGSRRPDIYMDRGAAGLWSWTQGVGAVLLNAWDPEGYVVRADGRFFVDFGPHGLWTGFGADLTRLNAADPEQLLVAPDGDLYVDYGAFGLWRRDDSGFSQLNAANPEGFVAGADGTLYVDYGPYGLWRRDASGFAQINAANPEGLAVTPDGTLFVDFGPFGFWRRDARGIVQVNPSNPEGLVAAADGSVFVDFGPFGLWRWKDGFAQLNAADPESMAAAADGSVYVDYGPYGLWRWTTAGIVQLNPANAESLTIARDGFLYIDFGTFGVWRRNASGALELIDATDPQGLAG